ncbi:MAG: helix-turn-helix domain-containing protein [Kiritimatiellae bacterium]|nr:helix-turn-helix domain-containing protein [Kiritimatiellia bacterium]
MILKHRDMELLRFDWLEPQGDRVVSVTEENRRLLPNIKTDPFVTADEVAELLGVSRRTVLREIARLREEGRITRVGSDKTGHGVVK